VTPGAILDSSLSLRRMPCRSADGYSVLTHRFMDSKGISARASDFFGARATNVEFLRGSLF